MYKMELRVSLYASYVRIVRACGVPLDSRYVSEPSLG